jgi:chromate transport protein ChrA
VAVSGWCGSASAVGYLLHGPVAAAVALADVVLPVCAVVAVLRPVLLGDSDPRSPFVRFMLVVCVLIGRPPGEYLPPELPEH